MGWEWRGDRRYYYSARKVEGRVLKQYFGAGETADAIAQVEALERERAEREELARRQEQQHLDALDAQVQVFCDDVHAVLAQTLEAVGYHRHARGEWRKRRGAAR